MPKSNEKKYRSSLEEDFAKMVEHNGGFAFEPLKMHYVVHRQYVPDFVHDKSDIWVECKGFFRAGDTQKYKAIQDDLEGVAELVFLLYDPKKKLRKGSKMNMGEWCTKEGFKFFTLNNISELLDYVSNAERNKRKTSE